MILSKLKHLLILLAFISTANATTLRNYSAEYDFSILKNHVATLRHVLQQKKDGQFTFKVFSNPINHMIPLKNTESSTFKIVKNHLVPIVHHETKVRFNGARQSDLIFDWKKNIAKADYNKLPWQHSIEKNTQDNLTHILQLKIDLQKHPEQATFKYIVAKPGKIKNYPFEVEGTEKLNTIFGEIETIKVSNYKPRRKRLTTFWFAPSKNFLLVKMLQEEAGSEIGLATLKSVQYFD